MDFYIRTDITSSAGFENSCQINFTHYNYQHGLNPVFSIFFNETGIHNPQSIRFEGEIVYFLFSENFNGTAIFLRFDNNDNDLNHLGNLLKSYINWTGRYSLYSHDPFELVSELESSRAQENFNAKLTSDNTFMDLESEVFKLREMVNCLSSSNTILSDSEAYGFQEFFDFYKNLFLDYGIIDRGNYEVKSEDSVKIIRTNTFEIKVEHSSTEYAIFVTNSGYKFRLSGLKEKDQYTKEENYEILIKCLKMYLKLT